MPRLRKVQHGKYRDLRLDSGDDDDDLPIDSLRQEQVINTLKRRAGLTHSREAKVIFRCYLVLLLVINMVLVTVPYYRKSSNVMFSALACIMLFSPSVMAYATIYGVDRTHLPIMLNIRFLLFNLVLYSISTVVKFLWFRVDTRADLLYVLPILFGVCILDLHTDNSQISQAIDELEKLRYDYKEA